MNKPVKDVWLIMRDDGTVKDVVFTTYSNDQFYLSKILVPPKESEPQEYPMIGSLHSLPRTKKEPKKPDKDSTMERIVY